MDNPVKEPEAASRVGEIWPNGFGYCKLGGVIDNLVCILQQFSNNEFKCKVF